MNRQMVQHRIENRFLAMLFGLYDAASRSVTLASAGFPRPILVREGQVRELDVQGIPLGMFADVSYAQIREELQPGDLLVAFSDGICESLDHNREEFGVRKLQSVVIQQAAAPAQRIADEVLRASKLFVRDTDREGDDRTVVVLKVI